MFSSEQFITIDTTDPTINPLTLNTTYFCGDTSLKLTCNTYDSSTIDNVKITATSPSGSTNYSAEYESGNDYFANFTITEEGTWNTRPVQFFRGALKGTIPKNET